MSSHHLLLDPFYPFLQVTSVFSLNQFLANFFYIGILSVIRVMARNGRGENHGGRLLSWHHNQTQRKVIITVGSLGSYLGHWGMYPWGPRQKKHCAGALQRACMEHF